MKVQTKWFQDFVRKASLNGKIMTINIDFTKEGLESSVVDFSKTGMTLTKLKKEAFESYETIGEIYIKNTKAFITYLGGFEEWIDLSVEDEYVLRLADDKRKGYILLGSELVCENKNTTGEPTVEYTAEVFFVKGDLAQSLKDMNDLAISQIAFVKTKDSMEITVGEKGESDYFVANMVSDKDSGTGNVKLGELFKDVYSVMEEDIQMKFGSDIPARFHCSNEMVDLVCIVAPMVDES